MNVICVICRDRLVLSEDVYFTRCGHMFHLRCLSQWLGRSETCPHCRERVTQNKIHKVYFMFSDTASEHGSDYCLQERVDSLNFQILLRDKNIEHYTTKNATLENQNAGLRREVRKVESEINQKNTLIFSLREQVKCLDEKYLFYKKKLTQKEKEFHLLDSMHKTLLNADVMKMVETSQSQSPLTKSISLLKKKMLKKETKLKTLQDRQNILNIELQEGRSQILRAEDRLICYRSENLCLQNRIAELEHLLNISKLNNVKSSSQKHSNENSFIVTKTRNICSQTNTRQETGNENDLSPARASSETEVVTNMSQESCILNPTPDEYPTVAKRARLHSQSGNDSNKANDMITLDVRSNKGTNAQSNSKQFLKTKSI